MKTRYLLLVAGIALIALSIAIGQSYTTWDINPSAKVEAPVLLHSWRDPDRNDHYLYRCYDWQAGNVVYIVSKERFGEGGNPGDAMAVVPLRQRGAK